jgi:hypothetical protein
MSRRDNLRIAGAACLAAALHLPALAESLASSASSAGSASSGSASDSIKGSSNSSGAPAKVAAGDYRIEAVTAAADRPGMVRVALQAVARDGADSAFVLVLPQVTFEQQGLARGDTVSARARPYGLEFARTDTRAAFFLVLADDWKREIDARPVTSRM